MFSILYFLSFMYTILTFGLFIVSYMSWKSHLHLLINLFLSLSNCPDSSTMSLSSDILSFPWSVTAMKLSIKLCILLFFSFPAFSFGFLQCFCLFIVCHSYPFDFLTYFTCLYPLEIHSSSEIYLNIFKIILLTYLTGIPSKSFSVELEFEGRNVVWLFMLLWIGAENWIPGERSLVEFIYLFIYLF